MTFEAWLLFVTIWLVAGLPFGPNAANCVAVAARYGLGRALWAVAGILAAGLVYMTVVVLGLGALLTANPVLFTALKIAGALYLIWLGIGLLRAQRTQPASVTGPAAPGAVVRKAALISFSNPKAMISYGAVFSQFITPDQALATQLLVIVPTATAVTALVYLGYAVLGVGARQVLNNAARMRLFNRGVGGFYLFAGTALIAGELEARR